MFYNITSGCPAQNEVVAIEIRLGFNVEDSRGLGTRSSVKVAEPPLAPGPAGPLSNSDVVLLGGSGGGSVVGTGGGTF